jgi:hypothetical protein
MTRWPGPPRSPSTTGPAPALAHGITPVRVVRLGCSYMLPSPKRQASFITRSLTWRPTSNSPTGIRRLSRPHHIHEINPSAFSHLQMLASSPSVLSPIASYLHEPFGYCQHDWLVQRKTDPCKVRQVTSAFLKKSDERTGSAVRKCKELEKE